MRNTLIIAATVALSLLAAPALAGDRTGNISHKDTSRFTLIYLDQLERNNKTPIRNASKAKVAAAQAQASRDNAVVRALRAKGVSLKNVMGTAKAWNGVTIYYIR